MKQRLLRFLRSPNLYLWLVLLAVLPVLPSLDFGLMADDYMQKAKILEHRSGVLPDSLKVHIDDPTLEMFVFMSGKQGEVGRLERRLLPWWASEDIKAAFFRPLSALTHELDYWLWPDSPALMHLHSLLWMALCVCLVSLLYRRLLGPGPVFGLAALLFALEDAHAGPVSWLANRNALVATSLGVLALILHDLWRRDGRRWAGAAAVVAFGAALLAGELALTTSAFLLGYTLFLEHDSRFLARVLSLAPYAAVGLVWAVLYRLGGYGTAGSLAYVSPLSLDFPQALLERAPILLASQWTQIPPDLWIGLPRWGQLACTAASIVVVIASLCLLRPLLKEDPGARFWATGMLLGLVPVCASFPMDRLLVFVGVGAIALLALWLERAGLLEVAATSEPRNGADNRSAAGPGRKLGKVALGLVLLHLVATPLLLPLRAVGTYWAFETFSLAARELPPDPKLAEQQVVFLNGASFLVGYGSVILALEGGIVPAHTELLNHMLSPMYVRRVSADTLEIDAPDGWLATPAEALLRSPREPFSVGQVFERPGMTVRVLETTGDGRPKVVRFRFPVSLDDPSLRWFYWKDGYLLEFPLPEVGRTVFVDWSVPSLSR